MERGSEDISKSEVFCDLPGEMDMNKDNRAIRSCYSMIDQNNQNCTDTAYSQLTIFSVQFQEFQTLKSQ